MTLPAQSIKAVCFDYGNTLIEFGPRQVRRQNEAILNTLTALFGHCDTEKLKTIRDRQIVAPYHNNYKENLPPELGREVIRELYDLEAEDHQLNAITQARYETFVEDIVLKDGVMDLLVRLRKRYRLGFLSNYPCSRSIRDSLTKIGLDGMFDAVVVSGDVGLVKPHPKPYKALLSQLDLPPEACVYVGDNWLADIQGAKGQGMFAIHTTQYVAYESFKPKEGDTPPDATIHHIGELEGLLLG